LIMVPKTELQKKVVALSKTLPKINREIKQWGYDNCITRYAVRSRKVLYCLECGHHWKDTAVLVSVLTGCSCPKCGKHLVMMTHYRPRVRESEYFAVITTAGGMQVIRMIYICKHFKKLQKPEWFAEEVMQHWITPEGKITTMSLTVMGFSQYYDQWIFDGKLEVRLKTYRSAMRYNIYPGKIYPEKKVLPVIRRNGFRGYFHAIAPHQLFAEILSDSVAETLLKARQISMLRYYIGFFHESEAKRAWSGIWSSIRICIRNNYIIKDASMWIDYLNVLSFYRKDLRSPHYVCPQDLKAAHDHWVRKKRDYERRQELIERRKNIEKQQIEYAKKKGRFFGLLFTDGTITVKPLQTIEEFIAEGNKLKHCVYASGYHQRDDSLIMSARLDQEPLETVEVSLRNLRVIQARGRDNQPTRHHEKIVTLIQDNMHQIGQLCRKKRERAEAV
jgi:hypothetical protein